VRVNLKEKVGKRNQREILWKAVDECGKEKEVEEVEEVKAVKEKARWAESREGEVR